MHAPNYLHLTPGQTLPLLESVDAFKAVLIIEDDVTPEWQTAVSDWLVRGGCRYMMAWGRKCGAWDDSVDLANLRLVEFGEIPEDAFVMTTWHEKDVLKDVFWFATYCAMHPSLDLTRTYIVHIAAQERSAQLLQAYREAQGE